MKKILLILTLLSIPAARYLLQSGGYEPHDLHHLADIYQMSRAFSSGQIPPRLGPDFLYEFGYPLFNYYYVLPFYIGAFLYSAFGSLMAAFKGVFLVSILLSIYGMYLFLNKFFGKAASIAGAVLYLYTPFRAVEIFVRGAIGEAFAIALFPFVLWAIATLVNKTTKKNIAIAALVFALFLLTHNYFFLLVSPFVFLFTAILVFSENKKVEKLKGLAFAGILGLGLSAYWWAPAFLEYSLVSSVTPFLIEDHFPFVKQLIIPSWGYGSSVWGPYDEISFQIGIVNLVLAAIAVPAFLLSKTKKDTKFLISICAFVFFGATIFMMNIRSTFLWNIIPFTNFIQFPWRLLSLTTFFTALLAAFVIDNAKFKSIFTVLVVASAILLTFNYFKPSGVFYRDDAHYIDRMFANPEFSEDYLLLPHDSSKKPDFVPEHRFSVEDGEVVSVNKISSVHWEAEINANEGTIIEAYVLNFPGWFVEVDGEEVETRSAEPYGHIKFDVSAGAHSIELYWAETNLRLLADLISAVSLVVSLALFALKRADRIMI